MHKPAGKIPQTYDQIVILEFETDICLYTMDIHIG